MLQQILLADNNVQILEALGDYLEELGFSVHRAASGEAALNIIKKENLSLLILSLGVRNPTSKALFTMAKESSSSPQIILLAEEFEHSDVRKLASEGAFDYLTKPFDEKQLEKTVIAALKTHQTILAKSILVRQLLSRTKKLEALTVEQAKRLAELHSLKEATSLALSQHNILISEVDELTLSLKEKEQALTKSKAKISEITCLPPLESVPIHRRLLAPCSTIISMVLLYPALLPGYMLKHFPAMFLSGSTLSGFAFLLSMGFLCIAIYSSLHSIKKRVDNTLEERRPIPVFIRMIKVANSIAPALILLLQGYTVHFIYSGFEAITNAGNANGSAILWGAYTISEATLSRGVTLLMLSLVLMFGIIIQELIFLKYTIEILYDNYSKKSSTRTRIKSL